MADQIDVHAIIVDDASPDWRTSGQPLLDPFFRTGRCHWHRFDSNGGLTRSWNAGLKFAREFVPGFDYVCCTNSDVIFSVNWHESITKTLSRGFDLVGPLSNAPGTEEHQLVTNYLPGYQVNDEQSEIDHTGFLIANTQRPPVQGTINGFCMTARTRTWWAQAYDADNVFRPRNDVNSKGQPNPTPLMTLNEYELQRRWHDKGLRSGVALGAFVFHFRAVSRGDKHRRGLWHRMHEA